MPTIKEIAIAQIREKTHISDINWADALLELEVATVCLIKDSYAAYPVRLAEKLLKRMVDHSEFMIALVFSPGHEEVTAIPIHESFDPDVRQYLVTNILGTDADMHSLSTCVIGMLLDQKGSFYSFTQPDVLILAQNLGPGRSDNPMAVGYWNSTEAQAHKYTTLFNEWIQTTLQDMK